MHVIHAPSLRPLWLVTAALCKAENVSKREGGSEWVRNEREGEKKERVSERERAGKGMRERKRERGKERE